MLCSYDTTPGESISRQHSPIHKLTFRPRPPTIGCRSTWYRSGQFLDYFVDPICLNRSRGQTASYWQPPSVHLVSGGYFTLVWRLSQLMPSSPIPLRGRMQSRGLWIPQPIPIDRRGRNQQAVLDHCFPQGRVYDRPTHSLAPSLG